MLAVCSDHDLVWMTALFGGIIKPFASSHWFSPLSFILKFEGEVKQPTLLLEQCRGRFFFGGNRHCLFYHFQHITRLSPQRLVCV